MDDLTAVNGGNGHRQDEPSMLLRALSVLGDRWQFFKQHGITFGGKRKSYEILGYADQLTPQDYRERYDRGDIAGRIVDVLPDATWRGSMELIEDDKRSAYTEFEQAWLDLDQRLQIQAKFLRVDKLSRLSTFATILIGAPGDFNTDLPRASKPEDLLYLQVYPGGGVNGRRGRASNQITDCMVDEFEGDSQSPRFGLPKTYFLRRTDVSSPDLQRPVHWSRILHVAEGCLEDDITGQPALERVWNRLDDLDKVIGGGSEAFWLRANQGLHMNLDKDFAPSQAREAREAMLAQLETQAEKYRDQMQRMIRTWGVDIKTLGSDVANFAGPADTILKIIAGAKGIPLRILTGSEMGELASSQDRENFKDLVNGRQTGYAAPYIVRPLVDRLIAYGYLPTPTKYDVIWPHLQTMTEAEKVEGAKGWASVNQTNGVMVFTEPEIRAKWADKEPLTEKQKQDALEDKKAAVEAAAPPMVPEDEETPVPRAASVYPDDELVHVLEEAITVGNTNVIDALIGVTR